MSDNINIQAVTDISFEFLENLKAIKGNKHATGVALFCNLKHSLAIGPVMMAVLNSALSFAVEATSPEQVQSMVEDADKLFELQRRMKGSPT